MFLLTPVVGGISLKLILSHTNLDFDGFSSMLAAQKLYPEAKMVLPDKLSAEVEHFFAIYKDTFPTISAKEVSFPSVTEIILVDTNSFNRIGDIADKLPSAESLTLNVYDHHPETADTLKNATKQIERTGATVTILAEKLQAEQIAVTPFEATVFALGVYSDTGSFSYLSTTGRDLRAAAFFVENGANLRVVDQFREPPLKGEQQKLFRTLLQKADIRSIDGLDICITSHLQSHFTGHLADIAAKLIQITGADAVIAAVKMENKTFITGRGQSERVNLLPLMAAFNGGGHEQAASANVKDDPLSNVLEQIEQNISSIVRPALTAKELMSSPVRVIAPETTIETASKMLYRYGHTGFPIVENEQVIGIISRRDIDKALHHQLGHAPVKGYMTREPITISADETIETIREYMIDDQVGRLPVLENKELVGIVSRSDVIRAMHGKRSVHLSLSTRSKIPMKRQVTETMKKQLPPVIFQLLELIGKEAAERDMNAFLIGGMVRDLLLNRDNVDMDIVIEGDGILLAEELQKLYGGSIRTHKQFRTAVWKHPSGFKVDLTSARTEYYDFPAALPKVEMSTIKEDLFRRDFTINAMGVCISTQEFGDLLDYFHGYEDINKGRIRVLYNLSFVEDPTRILRAIRFETRFSFQMDAQTHELARQAANNLRSVSKARLAGELSKMFYEEDAPAGAKRMIDLSCLNYIISTSLSEKTILQRIQLLTDVRKEFEANHVKMKPSFWIEYLFVMFQDHHQALIHAATFALSKDDKHILNTTLHAVTSMTDSAAISASSQTGEWHRQLSQTKNESLAGALVFADAELRQAGINYVIKRNQLTPLVGGKELINAGFKPGPHFKDILFELEIIQLENPDITADELLQYANRVLASGNET
ncbi:tRNA nucleotidyltransferase (CCA-adding enzyme) [Salisediminibacterium halotolerans]|nr:tRNA nucleotidyltransferase (CCA-adding enzyme) [Actinophytocola xinjiangensis]RPE88463.1 tRNA nucleotidyltransferase (CCA-adding enzyme) [Salisediminibacterium halotolerans]TWG37175.1 tRNA nucleotidyltransferase (CCA-adding enzyme) [Salisediminibacterium halotolerans]GEL09002.1 tRNA nucleotidyltransferase [Salisediminibacterium halotolerans]